MPVAVKEYLAASPEAAQQFAIEARQLAILRHPSLPYVIDHFSLPGQGEYLVTEFIEGQSLQTMVAGLAHRGGKEHPQPAGGRADHLQSQEVQSLFWLGQVCEAVGYLHAQSPPIVHGDIKPANIKITSSRRAVLVDFGIARAASSAFTNAGRQATLMAGSYGQGFTAPEQYQGISDLRSDIYALGAALYAALTGKVPTDSIQRQMGQTMPAPRQLNPAITPRTEAAIAKAMELDPSRRFQSVADFQTALGAPVSGVLPVPPEVSSGGYEHGEPPAEPTGRTGSSSKSWLIWAIVAFLALCLAGSVLAGIGVYTLMVIPGQQTATQLSLEQSQTPLGAPSASPSASPSSALVPSPAATITPIVIPSVTPGLVSTPSSTPSLTSPASVSEAPPTVTGLAAAPTWVPCPGTYPSRLHVGDHAYVSFDPPLANRVRRQPNNQSVVLGFLQPGEKMEILDGPVCYNNWIWWQVRSLESDLSGWTVEGDSTSYWLVPY
jgi:serine/threonine-protein kinase